MTKLETGVLLVNLGTPFSPKPQDVQRYLIEFLTDPRVITESWIKRQLLVRGVIVPSRYKESAKSYQAIWTEQGSPLLVYGKSVQKLLQEKLGPSFFVELGMRYQEPSLEKAIDRMVNKGISHLIVLPLFPQYASATTGSVHQKVMEILSKRIVIPKLSLVQSYPDFEGMIEAFSAVSPLRKNYDHLLFSFHGLPEKQLMPGSPFCYEAQCRLTANALINRLQIPSNSYTICYQSRLGKEPWIQPYTSEVIEKRAKAGDKKILVFCPSFVCDCLETIYEIGIEYANEFKKLGGQQLDLVPGLNDHPKWIEALQRLVYQQL